MSIAAALAVSAALTAHAQPAPAAAPPPAAPAPADPAPTPVAPPSAWTEEPTAVAPTGAPAQAPPTPPPTTPPSASPSADGAAAPPAEATAAGSPPSAAPNPPPARYEPEPPLTKYRQWDLGFELGLRNVVATDEGYDPYSANDALTSFALGATWMPLHFEPVTLGLAAEWTPGGSTGQARGDTTSLFVNRVAVGAQARIALGQRVYLRASVAPAFVAVSSNLDDPAIERPLEASGATWGLDATGGAAVLIARAGDPDAPAFRLWIVGDLGYSFSGTVSMVHTPGEVDDDPRRYGEVTLGELDTSGVVQRLAVALTF